MWAQNLEGIACYIVIYRQDGFFFLLNTEHVAEGEQKNSFVFIQMKLLFAPNKELQILDFKVIPLIQFKLCRVFNFMFAVIFLFRSVIFWIIFTFRFKWRESEANADGSYGRNTYKYIHKHLLIKQHQFPIDTQMNWCTSTSTLLGSKCRTLGIRTTQTPDTI